MKEEQEHYNAAMDEQESDWEVDAAQSALKLYKSTNKGYAAFSEAVYQLFKEKNEPMSTGGISRISNETVQNFIDKAAGRIEIVPSGRIDYCGDCKSEHGYTCPKETNITISSSKGTFSVSAEDFAEKFKESLYEEEYFPGHIEANLLDFLQGYSGVE